MITKEFILCFEEVINEYKVKGQQKFSEYKKEKEKRVKIENKKEKKNKKIGCCYIPFNFFIFIIFMNLELYIIYKIINFHF